MLRTSGVIDVDANSNSLVLYLRLGVHANISISILSRSSTVPTWIIPRSVTPWSVLHTRARVSDRGPSSSFRYSKNHPSCSVLCRSVVTGTLRHHYILALDSLSMSSTLLRFFAPDCSEVPPEALPPTPLGSFALLVPVTDLVAARADDAAPEADVEGGWRSALSLCCLCSRRAKRHRPGNHSEVDMLRIRRSIRPRRGRRRHRRRCRRRRCDVRALAAGTAAGAAGSATGCLVKRSAGGWRFHRLHERHFVYGRRCLGGEARVAAADACIGMAPLAPAPAVLAAFLAVCRASSSGAARRAAAAGTGRQRGVHPRRAARAPRWWTRRGA